MILTMAPLNPTANERPTTMTTTAHVCDLRTDGAGPVYHVTRSACPACREAACYVCGGDAHTDSTAAGGHRYWPTAEATAELEAEARRQGPPVYSSGARSAEAAYVAEHRPY